MTKYVNLDGSRTELFKAMVPGSSFELEQIVPEMTEYRGYMVPQLLTNLCNPSIVTLTDDTFKYDSDTMTAALPEGKRYDDIGPTTLKDRPKQHLWQVPSTGIQFSVKNRDVKNKRIPGTNEMMSHEYLIAREQTRIARGYDLFNEFNFAKLLTADVMDNRDGGLYYTSPNFYTEIVGSPRGADTLVNLAGTDLSTYRSTIEDARDAIAEEAGRLGLTITGWTMVAGKDYFNGVRELEANENLAREIRGIDLAQEGTQVLSVDAFNNLRFLDGSDGVRYIRYGANILTGQKLIADDKAILIPSVEGMFSMAFAPTDNDPDLCTQEARTMYTWTEKNRRGYHFAFERNCLYINRYPQLIKRFDADAA